MRTGLVLILLAQVGSGVEALPEWARTLVQLGSFAALCFVLWWLLTKYLPLKDTTFTEALKEITADSAKQRELFRETLEKMQLQCEARASRIMSKIENECEGEGHKNG